MQPLMRLPLMYNLRLLDDSFSMGDLWQKNLLGGRP